MQPSYHNSARQSQLTRYSIGHAASVWINDVFIDTVGSLTAVGDVNAIFTFPKGSIVPGQDNVITVLQDHMGNNEGTDRTSFYKAFTLNLSPRFAEKSERGIRGFELYGGVGNFSTWKVQGKLGGYTGYVAAHVHHHH